MLLINDDAIKVMKAQHELGVKVDLIVTDPPFRCISGGRNDSLSAQKYNSPSGVLTKNDGKIFDYNDIEFEQWVPLAYSLLKDDSDFYCITNLLNLFKLKEVADSAGFKLHNLLVWEKPNSCTPNKWYMKNAEFILYFYKGKARIINDAGSKMVHQFKNPVGNKLHPTEKPVELMELYVRNSSNPGDVVLDPFMGVGTTGIACKRLQRDFIGIEIDKKYYDIAKERLGETTTKLKVKL